VFLLKTSVSTIGYRVCFPFDPSGDRAISHVGSMGDVKQGSRSNMQGIFAGACPVCLAIAPLHSEMHREFLISPATLRGDFGSIGATSKRGLSSESGMLVWVSPPHPHVETSSTVRIIKVSSKPIRTTFREGATNLKSPRLTPRFFYSDF
jgi:hypothetical protein